MDREQASELLPIIEAFVQGATIQLRRGEEYEWMDAIDPIFRGEYQYRVKPESVYRPYNDGELIGLIGKIVHHISGAKSMITGVHNGKVYCEGRSVTSKSLLDDFKFLNGDRCGMKTNSQAIQEG